MITLLAKDYSYNYMAFEGSNGIYRLQGTECEEGDNIYNCVDTFKDQNGKYLRIRRKLIMEKQQKKKITPLEESRVIVKQYSKKDDKLRRAV